MVGRLVSFWEGLLAGQSFAGLGLQSLTCARASRLSRGKSGTGQQDDRVSFTGLQT